MVEVDYKIKGEVVDFQTLNPISGVIIKSFSSEVTTNSKGKFTLKGKYEEDTQFSITITAENYTR
jgi:hypothetical protein